MELGELFVAFISKIHLLKAGPDRSISIDESAVYGRAKYTNSFPISTMNMPYFSLLRRVIFRSCEPALYIANVPYRNNNAR